jgi:phage tail-like protein
MPPRPDPLGRFNFLVEIENVPAAAFTECSGLSSETDVIAYREGGDAHIRYLPGLTHYARIVLKRGLTTDRALWDWRQTVIEGRTERRTVTIVVLAEDRTPALRWRAVNAWPAKWEGPALNARSSDVAIETLELVHEGLELD